MTSIAQRQQLQATIWRIANEVRGAVDGWDFKQYVLGTLFLSFHQRTLHQLHKWRRRKYRLCKYIRR